MLRWICWLLDAQNAAFLPFEWVIRCVCRMRCNDSVWTCWSKQTPNTSKSAICESGQRKPGKLWIVFTAILEANNALNERLLVTTQNRCKKKPLSWNVSLQSASFAKPTWSAQPCRVLPARLWPRKNSTASSLMNRAKRCCPLL